MAQRSGDVRLPPDVREIRTFEESSSFETGPSGDVPPPVPGSAVPRPRSTATRGFFAAAPLPYRDGRPSASEEDCRMVDGVRRALRFLFEAEQCQLEQALRDTQVGYLMHCFSSLWEDSDEASSAATDVEHRTGRARKSRTSRSAGDVPEPEPLLGDDTRSSESEPDAEILGPAVPPGGLAMKTQGVVPRRCSTSTIVSGTSGAGRQTPTTTNGGRAASSRCAGSRGHSWSRVRYPRCTCGPTSRVADVWRRSRTLQGAWPVSSRAPRAVHACVAVTRGRDVSGATATMSAMSATTHMAVPAAAQSDADRSWRSVYSLSLGPVALCCPPCGLLASLTSASPTVWALRVPFAGP